MIELKTIIGVIAIILTFIGYIPYLKDIQKGKTKPHIYSWFIWAFIGAITFALQLIDNADFGALVTAAGVLGALSVFMASLLKKHQGNITKSDTIFFILAILSLIFWLVIKRPVISIILLTTTSMLGLIPTIRKSWNKPYSETIALYFVASIRYVLTIIALFNYSWLTTFYPVAWLIANSSVAVMLNLRRRQIPRPER